MPLFYHGSVVGGETLLQPFASPHSKLKEAAVYLSASKALAAVYIWNKAYKWMTFHIREDGMPVSPPLRRPIFRRFGKKRRPEPCYELPI